MLCLCIAYLVRNGLEGDKNAITRFPGRPVRDVKEAKKYINNVFLFVKKK